MMRPQGECGTGMEGWGAKLEVTVPADWGKLSSVRPF